MKVWIFHDKMSNVIQAFTSEFKAQRAAERNFGSDIIIEGNNFELSDFYEVYNRSDIEVATIQEIEVN